MVIEINPFLNSTGAGFFNWVIDYDVLSGKNINNKEELNIKNIAFRVANSPYANVSSFLTIFTCKK